RPAPLRRRVAARGGVRGGGRAAGRGLRRRRGRLRRRPPLRGVGRRAARHGRAGRGPGRRAGLRPRRRRPRLVGPGPHPAPGAAWLSRARGPLGTPAHRGPAPSRAGAGLIAAAAGGFAEEGAGSGRRAERTPEALGGRSNSTTVLTNRLRPSTESMRSIRASILLHTFPRTSGRRSAPFRDRYGGGRDSSAPFPLPPPAEWKERPGRRAPRTPK